MYFINKRIKRKNQLINSQNAEKDKLFSVISHDMRSPLSQAVGMLSILETGDLNLNELAAVAPFVKNDIENTLI